MRHPSTTKTAILALVIVTVLSGCATVRRGAAPETTSLLTQAGFKVLPADTPERVARLKTLPAYKVIPWKRQSGGTVYAYAEPDQCKCVYVGSPKQYATYRSLLSTGLAAEGEAAFEPPEFSDSTIEAGG